MKAAIERRAPEASHTAAFVSILRQTPGRRRGLVLVWQPIGMFWAHIASDHRILDDSAIPFIPNVKVTELSTALDCRLEEFIPTVDGSLTDNS